MKNSELIEHIESFYDVKSIKYKSLDLWLEVRNRIYTTISLGQESTLNITVTTYRAIFFTCLYGFFNWFKSYDVWIFSAKINRLKIDENYHDRLYEYIGTKYNKTLFIEVTTDKHFKRNLVKSKYIVSRSALILIEKCVALFISTKSVNTDVIAELNKDYKINFNPDYSIKKMVSQYKVMTFLLKFKSPEIVFLSPAYTAYGYIKAFKEKGVKVVEVQHGVILKEHFGYNVYEKFDQNYFVDYLLTFGEQERTVFDDSIGILKNNVLPVGNYYLDYINHHFKENKKLNSLIIGYEKSFVVSLQEVDKTEGLIPNIIEIAKINTNCIFLLKTRKISAFDQQANYKKLNNVIFIDDINIYQLIMQTDFHITVYSTCAIEAPALGKHNILFNMNNLSKSIFETTLTDLITTTYVNNVSEFNSVIQNIKKTEKSDILGAHKSVIKSGYKTNIDEFFNTIGFTNE